MWSNDMQCKYMFMFPLKNLARKGLSYVLWIKWILQQVCQYWFHLVIHVCVCISSKWKQNTSTWWCHQIETISALLALCAGNSPATGEFPSQRPVTRNFDVVFDLWPNTRLRKQSWGLWFETPSRSLWRHCNDLIMFWCLCSTHIHSKFIKIM